MRRGGLYATIAVVVTFVVGVPLGILLLLDPAASAQCATRGGPGPSSVAGIPQNLLGVLEGAAQRSGLGPDGWAYLAALDYAESTFATSTQPGVASGTNSAGAAGPMQIGVGGRATDNWDTVVGEIPANLPGGAEPPSVYNEVDAVYAAAALLARWGAPRDWRAALWAWNPYPPEISEVTRLVAQYTHGQPAGSPAASGPAAAPTTTAPAPVGGACAPPTGPTVAGAVAKILPNGTAAIPAGAPLAVQQAIAAGNRIIDGFYSQQRRPNMLTQVQDSYDCSGATDFVLANAGLSSPQVDVGGGVAGGSSLLESYGERGPGQWITVYGSANHAFIVVAGIVLDTAHYAPVQPARVPDPYPPDAPANGGPTSGPRWQPPSIIAAQLRDGNTWSQRHPGGL